MSVLRFVPSGRVVASPTLGSYLRDGSQLAEVLAEYDDDRDASPVFEISDDLFPDLMRRIQEATIWSIQSSLETTSWKAIDITRAWYDFACFIMHDELMRVVKQHLHAHYRTLLRTSLDKKQVKFIFACQDECDGCRGKCSRGYDTRDLPMVKKLAPLFVPLFHRSPHYATLPIHNYWEPRSNSVWCDFTFQHENMPTPMGALADIVAYREPNACMPDSAKTVASLKSLLDACPTLREDLKLATAPGASPAPKDALVEASVLLGDVSVVDTKQDHLLLCRSLYPEVCQLARFDHSLALYSAGMANCNMSLIRSIGDTTTICTLHDVYVMQMHAEHMCNVWGVMNHVDARLASSFYATLQNEVIGETRASQTFVRSLSPQIMTAVLKNTSLRPQSKTDFVTLFRVLGAKDLSEITAKHILFYKTVARTTLFEDLTTLVLCKASYLLARTPEQAIEAYARIGARCLPTIQYIERYYSLAPFAFKPSCVDLMLQYLKRTNPQRHYLSLWRSLRKSVEKPEAFSELWLASVPSAPEEEIRRWRLALDLCIKYNFMLDATPDCWGVARHLLEVEHVSDADWVKLGKIYLACMTIIPVKMHLRKLTLSYLKDLLTSVMPRMCIAVESLKPDWVQQCLVCCDLEAEPYVEESVLAILDALDGTEHVNGLLKVPSWTGRACLDFHGHSLAVVRRVMDLLPDHATDIVNFLLMTHSLWLSTDPNHENFFAFAQTLRVDWDNVQLPHIRGPYTKLRTRIMALRRRHKRSRTEPDQVDRS